uniref:Uncharacterized protein n=1 Tax=viral metagenome TaxID=1070528 RepID=A0A6H1ZZH6_9ZZZZ
MGNGKTVKERLAVVEVQIQDVQSDVAEIKSDVKKLLKNGATAKGKATVWDKVIGVILGAVAGFFAGKFGH